MSNICLARRLCWLIPIIIAIAAGVWFLRDSLPFHFGDTATVDAHDDHDGHDHAAAPPPVSSTFSISPQAQKNLRLSFVPLQTQTYWRALEFPATIVDRPGITDRGVTAPISGVVAKVHAFPGDAVSPDAPLVTLRLQSESLQASQLELYKAAQEIEIAQRQQARLQQLAESGALPGARLLEVENQIQRLQAAVRAHRQDLQSRGLPAASIDAAERGAFATEIVVRAPGKQAMEAAEVLLASGQTAEENAAPFQFEVESLSAELGKQVAVGEVLCHLADHRLLLVEARGFKDEMDAVQNAARHNWPVQLELDTPDASDWPPLPVGLPIDHIGNTVDAATRTFGFFIPLVNQWQTYRRGEEQHVLWRFRPGVRLRIKVPVEKIENVFVVPREAVVRDGADAYVFRQYGDKIKRRGVHVLLEDRTSAVLANDGSVRAGNPIAQSSAAALNRVLKSQATQNVPAGMHVHADGSVHGAH